MNILYQELTERIRGEVFASLTNALSPPFLLKSPLPPLEKGEIEGVGGISIGLWSDMERVVQRALRAWPQAQKKSAEQDVYLDSVALNLHSFYSGIERLFELIARHVDGALPTGETWHRDLLQQMAEI